MDREKKPALLEFDTYRWLEHCGPNWDTIWGIVRKASYEWMDRCPIQN